MKEFIVALVIGSIFIFIAEHFNRESEKAAYLKGNVDSEYIKPHKAQITSSYKCDGRQYCSEMHSCEEAKYFLDNCPTVKMDGDGDRIPCEDQFCGH